MYVIDEIETVASEGLEKFSLRKQKPNSKSKQMPDTQGMRSEVVVGPLYVHIVQEHGSHMCI